MIIYPPQKNSGYTAGGKALGLLKLLVCKEINVPDFIIVPAENFDEIIQSCNGVHLEIREQLKKFQFSSKEATKIDEIIKTWQTTNEFIIVRSSIADEDGKQDAFAGIMESYSNLSNLDEVLNAVNECAASAFSDKALAYRRQKNISAGIRPAVIIQKQINADVSGVIFSTYPVFPAVMAINAVWGMGEGLVNGDLNADEFYLDKCSGKLDFEHIADKEFAVAFPQKGKSKFTKVKENDRMKACLNTLQLQEVFKMMSTLEKKFSHPLDIEFVVSDDNIYIVQARPITQVIPEQVVYDNSNIQESFNGVTTALTFSFAHRAYATVYRQTMQILSLPKQTLEEYEPVINNLLGNIKGRIYYNINNWYKGLQLLPSFKQNKEDMERMMGLEEPVAFVVDTEKSFLNKLKVLPSLFLNLLKLLQAFSNRKKNIKEFLAHFETSYEYFYSHLNGCDSPEKIKNQKEWLDKKLLNNWTTPIINDFYLMMVNGKVRRKLNHLGFTNPDEFLSEYFAGNQDVESAKQALDMQKMALDVLNNLALKELLITIRKDLHEVVREHHPDFFNEVEHFIKIYGDRTIGELKLETMTMRRSPGIFYSYLRNYLLNPGALQKPISSSLHENASQELKKKWRRRPAFYRKNLVTTLKNLQEAIRHRESMRLQRTRLFGMYRSLYLVAAAYLVKEKRIRTPEDIFHLTENEIFQLLNHHLPDAEDLIENRKIELQKQMNEEAPSRVLFPPAPYKKSEENFDCSVLSGTGCVAGIVTGEIIVINHPEDDLNVNGKIICAQRTDPGWVALFPACKGVLIEKGSPLSHSVILLREFGIPAIINIKSLSKKLKSGDNVRMDGTTGKIEILKEEN